MTLKLQFFLAKHRVNKQLVSWQSTVMEHEVLSSVLQIEFSQLVSFNKNNSSRENSVIFGIGTVRN